MLFALFEHICWLCVVKRSSYQHLTQYHLEGRADCRHANLCMRVYRRNFCYEPEGPDLAKAMRRSQMLCQVACVEPNINMCRCKLHDDIPGQWKAGDTFKSGRICRWSSCEICESFLHLPTCLSIRHCSWLMNDNRVDKIICQIIDICLHKQSIEPSK